MFTLSESVISKNGIDLLVEAQYNFANPAEIGFVLNTKYKDLSWNIEGQILDKTTLIIRDKSGLNVYGSLSNSGGVSGYMEGVDFPILVNDKTVYFNFYITLRYTSNDFWYVDIAHFNARDLNSSQGINFISVSGAVDNNGASFRNLLLRDNIGDLAGSVNFAWDADFSYLNFLVNLTDGREKGENYSAEGTIKKDNFNIIVSASDMRFDRLLKHYKGGSGVGEIFLSGKAEVTGDSSIKSFAAKCDLESLYLKNSAVKASGEVVFTNDEFTAADLNLEYKNIKTVIPVLQLSRNESCVRASGEIQGVVLSKWLESNFELNANFQNIDSWLEIDRALASVNGFLKVDEIQYGYEEQAPFSFVFTNNNGALSVSGGPKNMLKFEMDNEGNFFTSLSSPLPIRSTIVGIYKNGNIDAHCSDFYMDLSAIWEFTDDVSDFAMVGGYVTGKVDIRGPVSAPEFFGTVRGTSIRFLVPNYIGEDIKPVPFNAVIEGDEIVFGPVPFTVGSGGGTIGGWLRFEKWIPENVGLEVTIPRNAPIPYMFNITGFIAKGDVSGKVNLLREKEMIDISGSLFANNTEMGFILDEVMQARNETEKETTKTATVVNLTVTTGPVVEFIWPNTSSPILRANPEIGTVVTVFADTMTGQYAINSDITIRSGELYYFDRSFYIRRGNLVFRENDQQFAPRISARAEIRERTDSGPVTVSMIIDNEPLLSFVPRFEASPTLTQLEIYALLGHSMYAMGGNESGDTAKRVLLSSTTDIISQFFANSEFGQITGIRQFERMVRNLLPLDMFSVRTKILQNAAVSYAFGQTSVDRSNRVGNYFDNTTVYLGKYIGQDMFIQTMLTMRYDENTLSMGGLKFEPDFGVEFTTPLFNIRWDFFPYSPENWWVNDNSITLIWSKSF